MIRLALIAWVLLVGSATAQGLPQADLPPAGGPGLPQGMMTDSAAVPAVPDTARAVFGWETEAPPIEAIYMIPDTVPFGEIVGLVFEYPESVEAPVLPSEPPAEWLEYEADVSGEHQDLLQKRLASHEQKEGRNTLLVPVRIYRTDPFVIESGSVESPVIQVRGRTTDLAETAAIRAPRHRGWNLGTIAALSLALVLLSLLVWVLWRRRRTTTRIENWDPAAPGWLAAAGRLRTLLQGGSLDRGEGRSYLNELASIARGFAAERYGIAAREMTGREIVAACIGRGYAPDPARTLGRLVDEADRRRYDPAPVTEAWVRERTLELLRCIEGLRIVPRQTPVATERIFDADGAWSELQRLMAEWESSAAGSAGGSA